MPPNTSGATDSYPARLSPTVPARSAAAIVILRSAHRDVKSATNRSVGAQAVEREPRPRKVLIGIRQQDGQLANFMGKRQLLGKAG